MIAAAPPAPPAATPAVVIQPVTREQAGNAAVEDAVAGTLGPDNGVRLVLWTPGVVRCGGAFVAPARIETPLPSLAGGESFNAMVRPVTVRFRIDADGRPVSIEREAGDRGDDEADAVYGSNDIEPALAASTFTAGAKAECSISYTATPVRIDRATPQQLVSAMLSPFASAIASQVMVGLAGGQSQCLAQPPLPRVLYFPDVDTLAGTPGHIAAYAIRYDVVAGVPTNIRLLANTGDAALAAAATEAIGRSRWAPKATTGCVYAYGFPPQSTIAAPADASPPRLPKKGTCTTDARHLHVTDVPFPPAFQRRNIEGWARVRYDLAPWGAVGNVEVLQAEPASGFGAQARRVVLAAAGDKSASGYSGCVQRIMFKLSDDREGVSIVEKKRSGRRPAR